jgi:hypothetical protein
MERTVMKVNPLPALLTSLALTCSSLTLAADRPDVSEALSVLLSDFDQTERMLKRTPGKLTPGSEYTLAEGDTLRAVALASYGNTPLNQEIVRKLIFDQNRQAFFRNNPEFPLVGKVVRIPDIEDIRAYIFSYEKGTKFPHDGKETWIKYP